MRRFLRILTIASLASVGLATAPSAPAVASSPAGGRLLVHFRAGGSDNDHRAAHAAAHAHLERHLPRVDVDVVEADDPAAALQAYQARPDVVYAEPDGAVHALGAPNDQYYGADQWNLKPATADNRGSTDWEPAYPADQGEGVLVAVVDTGFRKGGVDEPVNLRWDLSATFVPGTPDATDDNGHGTFIAGTIAARTGDSKGSAGIAPKAGLIPVKVLNADGQGTVGDTAEGVLYAASKGAKVLNLSLGGDYSRTMCEVVKTVAPTTLVVAATGNEAGGGLLPVDYPAACPGVIAVGGARYDGTTGPYSNGSCETAILAPGGDLDPSTRLFPRLDPRNAIQQEAWLPSKGAFDFPFESGTSMAAAHVTGAATLLLGINPDITAVARVLRSTARDLGPAGPDDRTGWGGLDIAAAASALHAGTIPAPADKLGYWMVASDGGIFGFGDAPFDGSTGGIKLNSPIVGMARTATGLGYWLVAADGGIFAFGDAKFHGSTGGIPLNSPIVAMTPTGTGLGYWLVASDGGIFAFGDAQFYGSTGGIHLNKPIVTMVPTRFGIGYWLVSSDGGIFAFGLANYYGSTGGTALNKPIVTMARTPTGAGYWLVASDGGVFSFGDAAFLGSTGALTLNSPIVAMTPTCYGTGYWMVAADGGVFAFGPGAPFLGSMGGTPLNKPIVGMVLALDHRAGQA